MVATEMPPEVIEGFVAEARSYLPLILTSLQAIDDQEQLAEAYRFAHTIKSSAGMMGLNGLSQVAELLECDLEAFLLGEPPQAPHLAQLSRAVGRIGRLLDGVTEEGVDVEAILAEEVADRTGETLDETQPVPADTGPELAATLGVFPPQGHQPRDDVLEEGEAALVQSLFDPSGDGGALAEPDQAAEMVNLLDTAATTTTADGALTTEGAVDDTVDTVDTVEIPDVFGEDLPPPRGRPSAL
ncbi:MAG: Hpt domain-containing protein, partial [Chloroflexota bacterium]